MTKKKAYRPRAQSCTHCPKISEKDEQGKPLDPQTLLCRETGWLISKSVARSQAACKE
jgi:hypothetical protein